MSFPDAKRWPGSFDVPRRALWTVALVSTAIVLLLNGLWGMHNVDRLVLAHQRIDQAREASDAINELFSALKDAERGQRGYLLAHDDAYLKPYQRALEAIPQKLALLRERLADSAAQLARLDQAEQLITRKLAEIARTLRLAQAGDFDAAITLVRSDEGLNLMQLLRSQVEAMRDAEREAQQRREIDAQQAQRVTQLTGLVGALVGVLLVLAAAVLLRRDLRARSAAASALLAQREWLLTTLSSIADAVIVTDARGHIVLLNAVAERLTGWSAAAAERRPIAEVFDLIDERTREPVADPVAAALAQGRVVEFDRSCLLRARGGIEYAIEDSAAPSFAADGKIQGAVMVFRDVSERRNAERALRDGAAQLARQSRRAMASERTLNTLLENAPIGIFMTGPAPDFPLVAMSRQTREWIGSAGGGVAADVAYQKVLPDGSAPNAALRPLHRAMHEGIAVRDETWIIERRDAPPLRVLVSVAPVRDENAEIVGAIHCWVDLSERDRLEQRLRQQAEQLLLADRRKDHFLAMLGHELRNPLAALRNGVYLLAAPGGMSAARHSTLVASMRRQTDHLVRMVDDLLDVARISQDKITLDRRALDLHAALNTALEIVHPQIEASRHCVHLHLAPRTLWVSADSTRLVQMFTNILHNAAKYTSPGGVIAVSSEAANGCAVVRIADNGQGIDAELLPHIFDTFIQADQSLARTSGGLGVGLAVVRRLAELHGGGVRASSQGAGQGSEFELRLPLLDADLQPDAAELDAAAQPAALSPRRVLVVDDNADLATSTAALLEMWGHRAEIAHNGNDALAAALAFAPQIILLDIGLPELDGFEVALAIRARPELAGVRLIAVSGYGGADDALAAQHAGFDRYLVKPLQPDVLRELIEREGAAG